MKLTRSILILMMVGWGMVLAAAETPQVDPEILDVLKKVEAQINSSDYLSYHVVRTQEKLDSGKPASRDEVTIWAKQVPGDELHGAHFHIRGSDDQGPFDYYFDGEAGYAVRDQEKKVVLYRVPDFPIDVGHPALCMRTAVMFHLSRAVLDQRVAETLLKDHAAISMTAAPANDTRILRIRYKESRFGQKEETLEIDKHTFRIKRIVIVNNWNGILTRVELTYSNFDKDESAVGPNITLPEASVSAYTREVFSRGKSRNRPTPRLLIGEPAPAFNYKSFAGEDISLKKLSGKLVVLDFWETWCGHCQQAFPDVNKLQQKWGDRLVVIGVVSENKGEVQKVLDNADLSYQTIFADPNMVMEYHVNGRPTYFLIGPDGVVVECSVGNLKPIEAAVEKLFTKDSDSPQTTNDRVK